jgi:hypothetical protein
MAGGSRARPLWLTVVLYLVLVGVAVVDIWAAVFWVQVGGSLGGGISAAAIAVAIGIAALLAFDARRQWLLAGEDHEDE